MWVRDGDGWRLVGLHKGKVCIYPEAGKYQLEVTFEGHKRPGIISRYASLTQARREGEEIARNHFMLQNPIGKLGWAFVLASGAVAVGTVTWALTRTATPA